MKYKEELKLATEKLKSANVPDHELDAKLLMEFVTGMSRNDLFLHGEDEMPEAEHLRYTEVIDTRAKRIPLQHITGEQEFYGLSFKVNEHVLVPRQDTEILVEHVLSLLTPGDSVLDLCTGSGCIIITLLHENSLCTGIGSDISEDALSVAKDNANNNDVSGRVNFIHSDLYKNIDKKFDHIVSNPPYIKTGIIETLMPEVKDHDPYSALDGGEDGLYFYRIITGDAKDHLFKNRTLSFEVGVDEADDVKRIMEENGFTDIKIIKDYSGNDRVVSGRADYDY